MTAPLRRPIALAASTVVLVGLWQWAVVAGVYGGGWNALFYTGSSVAAPQVVGDEEIGRAPDEIGFDGQYYHFIAHDPWLTGDAKAFIDNPSLRYRRILVPALAWLAAFGAPAAVDWTYLAVTLFFCGLGVYWSARLMTRYGLPEALGLLFLAVPAAMISAERMTVDVALAAFCVGFALYADGPPSWRLYAVLALAPLARETGVVMAAACCLAALKERRLKQAAIYAATLAPFAAWLAYVHSQTPADATPWLGAIPLAGLVARTLNPFPDPMTVSWLRIAGVLELVAVLGVWAAIIAAIVSLRKKPFGPTELAAGLMLAGFAFLAKEDIWRHAYAFGRTLSPVIVWLALIGLSRRRWAYLTPLALTAPRVLFQLATVSKLAVKGIFG